MPFAGIAHIIIIIIIIIILLLLLFIIYYYYYSNINPSGTQNFTFILNRMTSIQTGS